jgi:hypothetical protein
LASRARQVDDESGEFTFDWQVSESIALASTEEMMVARCARGAGPDRDNAITVP